MEISYAPTFKSERTEFRVSKQTEALNRLLKISKSNQDIAISKLYSELGSYSSEDISKELRSLWISRIIQIPSLVHLNMRILAATLVILYFLRGDDPTNITFQRIFKAYIQNKFIVPAGEEKDQYYEKVQSDIFRYMRLVKIFQSEKYF